MEGKQTKGAIVYGAVYKPYLRASSCFKHAKFQSVVSEDGKVMLQRYWLVSLFGSSKTPREGCQSRLQVVCAACKPEQRF